jgi:hypothetical protein
MLLLILYPTTLLTHWAEDYHFFNILPLWLQNSKFESLVILVSQSLNVIMLPLWFKRLKQLSWVR